MQEGL